MLIYNHNRRTVTLDGQEVRLSNHESLVMNVLYQANGSVCSPDDLGEAVYGIDWYEGYVNSSSVEKTVSRIREKIGHNYIVTIKGAGWYFDQCEPQSTFVQITPREARLLQLFRSLPPATQIFMSGDQEQIDRFVAKPEFRQMSLLS